MTTIPLSNLVPSWKGQLIPEAYAAVEKGLRHQRARFLFDRYIVISMVHSLGYDDFCSCLYLDDGLTTVEESADTCGRVLQHRMMEGLIRFGPETEGWRTMEEDPHNLRQVPPRIDLMAWEKRGDGSGYNSVSVYVGVFEVNSFNPLAVDDLAAIGLDHDLVYFFGHHGVD